MAEKMKPETVAVHGANLGKEDVLPVSLPPGESENSVDRLEILASHLEGGRASCAVSSGMAAIHQVAISLTRTGDEIVSSGNIRPETNNLFTVLLRDTGVTVNFVYTTKPSAFDGAISPRTRFIFLELTGTVVPEVYDVAAIAAIAHKNKIPLIVDASGISPLVFRPGDAGADIIIRDLVHLFGIHSSSSIGLVTDMGNFDWRVSNVPLMKAGDPMLGNIRWAFDLPKEFSNCGFALRYAFVVQRTLCSKPSEECAEETIESLKGFPLRFEKQCENAMAVAKLLSKNKKISWIRYPGLDEDSAHEIAQKQFGKNYGISVVFGFSGQTEDANVVADRFLNALHLIQTGKEFLGSTSSARSYTKPVLRSCLPVRPTMPQILAQYPGLIRFSAGIENSKDLIDDINQALRAV